MLKGIGLAVLDINDESAIIDGGDVLFTGKEIFVGISKRTNHAGAAAVQEAFPGYKVHPIDVSGPLHLITLMGLCGEDTLCVSTETPHSMKMFEVSCISCTWRPAFSWTHFSTFGVDKLCHVGARRSMFHPPVGHARPTRGTRSRAGFNK